VRTLPAPPPEPGLPEPWRQDADDVLAALGSDRGLGLTTQRAGERLVPSWRRFLRQFAGRLVLPLVGAAVNRRSPRLERFSDGPRWNGLTLRPSRVGQRLAAPHR
jgi:hypothetical protein